MSLNDIIRKVCPDFLPIKKFMAKIMIKTYTRHLLPEKEVIVGESEEKGKKQVLNKYAKKWGRYARKCTNDVENICQKCTLDSNMRDNMLFYLFAFGFKPEEYLSYKFWMKPPSEYRQYISNVECMCYVYQMNDIIDSGLLHNKWQTYEKFKPQYRRDVICISGKKDYEKFQNFVQRHPIFIKKRLDSMKGDSVELIDINQMNIKDRESYNRFIAKGEYVLEEKIIQGRELALLHEASINTVRCATFYTKSGIKIGFCFLRVGQGASIVDNGGANGIEIGIDPDTGRLNSDGYDYYGNVYQTHPDSGIEFKGYQLPQWDRVITMCKEMASQLPTIRFIGWDMAFSENGWCVVEGNNAAAMRGPQICSGKGIKEKVKGFMDDMDLLA